METLTEKKFLNPVGYKEPEIILMHTYCLHASTQQRVLIKNKLDPEQKAMLCENDSDVCYFIIPDSDVEIFLAEVSLRNIPCKKISISELREKYSTNPNYTFFGNSK